MTRNLKWYLAFSVLWSMAFFAALNWGLTETHTRGLYIVAAGVGYGIGFALVGFLLGRPDDQSAVRYNLGYAYAAVGNIASATIGTVWIVVFQPSAIGGIPVYLLGVLAFAAVGAVLARRSIKGMSRERLFR